MIFISIELVFIPTEHIVGVLSFSGYDKWKTLENFACSKQESTAQYA
jgi:hypothetical protein